jgi:hypothetical protein
MNQEFVDSLQDIRKDCRNRLLGCKSRLVLVFCSTLELYHHMNPELVEHLSGIANNNIHHLLQSKMELLL